MVAQRGCSRRIPTELFFQGVDTLSQTSNLSAVLFVFPVSWNQASLARRTTLPIATLLGRPSSSKGLRFPLEASEGLSNATHKIEACRFPVLSHDRALGFPKVSRESCSNPGCPENKAHA